VNNICVGIITFNPDLKILEQNVEKLECQVNKIIIVDNCSNNFIKIKRMICKYKKIDIIENSDNYGIAVALNVIMKNAKRNGYLWVLTLDQDSMVEEDFISKFKYLKVPDNVAIMCPYIFDRNRRTIDSGMGKCKEKTEDGYVFVNKCITSGAITQVNIWEEVGQYDERLFIDYVDFDFCQRVRKQGYRILCIEEAKLSHSIGSGKVFKFLWWKVEVLNHSATRKYFISRNRIYCDYKYHNAIGVSIASNVKLFIKTLLFEKEKFNKCSAIVKGTFDGIKMIRTGD